MSKYAYILLFILIGIALQPRRGWTEGEFCPQATLERMEYIDEDRIGDPRANYYFSYDYSNPAYDTVPFLWEGVPSDANNALYIDQITVTDESEGGCFLWWCNTPWADWKADIYPLKYANECDSEEGVRYINCARRAFFDGDPARVHVSGPYLSNTNKCEWYEVGVPMLFIEVGGGVLARSLGAQHVDYDGFLIWDWDDWSHNNIYADGIWIDFWEGDEGFWDDHNLWVGRINANSDYSDRANHAIVWFSNVVIDGDNDGIIDEGDNCLEVANPGQEDMDGDGMGDACDSDNDQDGVADGGDNCPRAANPGQENTDGDGQGNACDDDDDNDGLSDAEEGEIGTDPQSNDTDGDGLSDFEEYRTYHTNPTLLDTDGDDLNDYEEVEIYNTDPLDTDTDDDALSDFKEIELGTNPLRKDNPAVMIITQYLLSDDEDVDGDNIPNDDNDSPGNANDDPADANNNGIGDDADSDGISDDGDNCPNNPNADQADANNDGIGDVCDWMWWAGVVEEDIAEWMENYWDRYRFRWPF